MPSPAGACIVPHLRCLRWCGFCRAGPSRAHYVYRLFALTACLLFLAQECVYAYQESADMDKLSRVMFLLLCHVTSLGKQITFHIDAKRIDALVAQLDDPLFNEAAAHPLLSVTAKRALRLQRIYSGCSVVTCALWLVFPVARYFRALPVEFSFWLPAAPRHPLAFIAVLMYSHYVTTLMGLANSTMDAFIGTILYQCTTQLKLLRAKLETLPERTRDAVKITGESFEPTLMKLFYQCLRHYSKIDEIISSLQEIFGTAILIQFTIGVWVLCMAAYRMVSLHVLSVEFASMILFIICVLIALFFYCYFGNELTYESAALPESLYACGWETRRGAGCGAGRGARFPRALLLAGERARRPLRAVAARLVPLSLETFLKIVKSSYSFYTVLRQTKRDDT